MLYLSMSYLEVKIDRYIMLPLAKVGQNGLYSAFMLWGNLNINLQGVLIHFMIVFYMIQWCFCPGSITPQNRR